LNGVVLGFYRNIWQVGHCTGLRRRFEPGVSFTHVCTFPLESLGIFGEAFGPGLLLSIKML